MTTLLVLRHARARRASPTGSDRDRPLDERGRGDAAAVGRRLAEEGLVPDLVLASSAERAADTARLAAEAGRFPDRVELLDELYDSDAHAVVELLRRRGPGHDRVLLVGHQPTLGELVELLSDRRAPLAPGALATVDLPPEDWEHLGRGVGRIVAVWGPTKDG